MCKFCIDHGDGTKWYLEASNYAEELLGDATRREYIVDFVRHFDRNRTRALLGAEVANALPGPLRRAALGWFTRRMTAVHFGQPIPIEDCERVFDLATSIVRVPCPCRTFAGRPEQGYCLFVTAVPAPELLEAGFADYRFGPDVSAFERLSKPQAMNLLRACENQGLMHSLWTFLTPFAGAICNCDLDSGCMAMRLSIAEGMKIMWRGEYVATLHREACRGCNECVERCPFGALSTSRADADVVRLNQLECWGCGVCRSACPCEALSLLPRTSVPAVAGLW